MSKDFSTPFEEEAGKVLRGRTYSHMFIDEASGVDETVIAMLDTRLKEPVIRARWAVKIFDSEEMKKEMLRRMVRNSTV